MNNQQQLGGTRQSSPLDDEMSYPLTSDEYLLIKENLAVDKFTNWESFLVTTGITSLISLIVVWATGSFETIIKTETKDIIKINSSQVIIIIIYGAATLGSLFGFVISRITKKKSINPIQRLDAKITNHLKKIAE